MFYISHFHYVFRSHSLYLFLILSQKYSNEYEPKERPSTQQLLCWTFIFSSNNIDIEIDACVAGVYVSVCVRVSVYHLCVYALSMHRRSRRFRLKFGLINDGAIILRCERILFSCQDILSFRDLYPPPPSHFVVYACIIGPGLVAKCRRTLGWWATPVRLSVHSHRAGICVIYF